jgi:hypothetical protein
VTRTAWISGPLTAYDDERQSHVTNSRRKDLWREERPPTVEEVAELLAYLPHFENRKEPFAVWEGGWIDKEKKQFAWPYPTYADDVRAFFRLVSKPQWLRWEYRNKRTHELVADIEKIYSASLEEVCLVLTACSRPERFFDGHREIMLEHGVVQAALRRLAVLFPDAQPEARTIEV